MFFISSAVRNFGIDTQTKWNELCDSWGYFLITIFFHFSLIIMYNIDNIDRNHQKLPIPTDTWAHP